ncbi:MAG: hypothetical protein VX733_13055 [Candidatus Latescibacterota bacterium]|nr:hypothetical protein [Candidatus Latescibacterota bacterium]
MTEVYHQPSLGVIEIDWHAAPVRVELQIRDVYDQAQLHRSFALPPPSADG